MGLRDAANSASPESRLKLTIRRGCEKDQGGYDDNRHIDNRVQDSRDCADSCRVPLPVPFKALMDGDQLDNTRATKRKAHEKERVDEGEVGNSLRTKAEPDNWLLFSAGLLKLERIRVRCATFAPAAPVAATNFVCATPR